MSARFRSSARIGASERATWTIPSRCPNSLPWRLNTLNVTDGPGSESIQSPGCRARSRLRGSGLRFATPLAYSSSPSGLHTWSQGASSLALFS